MLNIRKDLNKLGIVSVSALMLLGVGVGISSANTSVHAENTLTERNALAENQAIIAKLKKANGGHMVSNVHVKSPAFSDTRHEEQIDAEIRDRNYAETNHVSMKQAHKDIAKMTRARENTKPLSHKKQLENFEKLNREITKTDKNKALHHKRTSHKQSVKAHKEARHIRKSHVSSRTLKNEINNLNKNQRNLKRQIRRATNRKYHGRRAKRNAKRYINRMKAQYSRNNKQLRKLNRK